jgi:hypothetical protein
LDFETTQVSNGQRYVVDEVVDFRNSAKPLIADGTAAGSPTLPTNSPPGASSTPSPSSTASDIHSISIATWAIAGSVVGGIIVGVLVVFGIVLWRRKQQAQQKADQSDAKTPLGDPPSCNHEKPELDANQVLVEADGGIGDRLSYKELHTYEPPQELPG